MNHSLCPCPPVMKTLTVAVLAGLLSACAVGPNYRRPDISLSKQFRNAPTAHAVIDSGWWQAFEDDTLNRLVEQALQANLDIAQAVARLEQARAGTRHARALQLPSINAEASAASQRQSLESPIGRVSRDSPAFERHHEDYSASLTLSWEIDLFGRLKRQTQSAHAHYQASQADVQGLKITIIAETTDAWLNWRQAHELLALLEQRIAACTTTVALVKASVDAQIAEINTLHLAQADLAALQAERLTLEQIIEVQRNRLAVLTGVDPSQFTLPAPSADSLKLPTLTGFEQPADLLRRRPDVIAAEQRLIAATADIGSAIADYYPIFSLSGLLGWQATTTAALGAGNSAAATSLLGLRWRLFDFGRVNAQIEQAKGRQAEALTAWRQTMLLASEEVENTLMAIQTTATALHLHQQAHSELQTAWHNARLSFDQRTIGRVPILEAEDRVLANRQRQTQVWYTRARAGVGLNRVAGVL